MVPPVPPNDLGLGAVGGMPPQEAVAWLIQQLQEANRKLIVANDEIAHLAPLQSTGPTGKLKGLLNDVKSATHESTQEFDALNALFDMVDQQIANAGNIDDYKKALGDCLAQVRTKAADVKDFVEHTAKLREELSNHQGRRAQFHRKRAALLRMERNRWLFGDGFRAFVEQYNDLEDNPALREALILSHLSRATEVLEDLLRTTVVRLDDDLIIDDDKLDDDDRAEEAEDANRPDGDFNVQNRLMAQLKAYKDAMNRMNETIKNPQPGSRPADLKNHLNRAAMLEAKNKELDARIAEFTQAAKAAATNGSTLAVAIGTIARLRDEIQRLTDEIADLKKEVSLWQRNFDAALNEEGHLSDDELTQLRDLLTQSLEDGRQLSAKYSALLELIQSKGLVPAGTSDALQSAQVQDRLLEALIDLEDSEATVARLREQKLAIERLLPAEINIPYRPIGVLLTPNEHQIVAKLTSEAIPQSFEGKRDLIKRHQEQVRNHLLTPLSSAPATPGPAVNFPQAEQRRIDAMLNTPISTNLRRQDRMLDAIRGELCDYVITPSPRAPATPTPNRSHKGPQDHPDQLAQYISAHIQINWEPLQVDRGQFQDAFRVDLERAELLKPCPSQDQNRMTPEQQQQFENQLSVRAAVNRHRGRGLGRGGGGRRGGRGSDLGDPFPLPRPGVGPVDPGGSPENLVEEDVEMPDAPQPGVRRGRSGGEPERTVLPPRVPGSRREDPAIAQRREWEANGFRNEQRFPINSLRADLTEGGAEPDEPIVVEDEDSSQDETEEEPVPWPLPSPTAGRGRRKSKGRK